MPTAGELGTQPLGQAPHLLKKVLQLSFLLCVLVNRGWKLSGYVTTSGQKSVDAIAT